MSTWTSSPRPCADRVARYRLRLAQYHLGFYLQYLAHWPDLCMVAQAPSSTLMGYSALAFASHLCLRSCRAVLGKAEGKGESWHGHVTAVTVAPDFRRIGLANRLMDFLESVSEKMYVERPYRCAVTYFWCLHSYNGYFVDLFVRVSNKTAIGMYKKLGYIVYRQVREYYSGEEDAYGTTCKRNAHTTHIALYGAQRTGHSARTRLRSITVRLLITTTRHAKSTTKGCGKEIGGTTESHRVARGGRPHVKCVCHFSSLTVACAAFSSALPFGRTLMLVTDLRPAAFARRGCYCTTQAFEFGMLCSFKRCSHYSSSARRSLTAADGCCRRLLKTAVSRSHTRLDVDRVNGRNRATGSPSPRRRTFPRWQPCSLRLPLPVGRTHPRLPA